MLGTLEKCPHCGHVGVRRGNIKLVDTEGLDPLMVKVQCTYCGKYYYLAPALNYKEKEAE